MHITRWDYFYYVRLWHYLEIDQYDMPYINKLKEKSIDHVN